MKKLSQQFLELSQHTAALENRAEATRAENRKEFEAHVSEARARVQALQDAFTTRLGEAEEPWLSRGVSWKKPSLLRSPVSSSAWMSVKM